MQGYHGAGGCTLGAGRVDAHIQAVGGSDPGHGTRFPTTLRIFVGKVDASVNMR